MTAEQLDAVVAEDRRRAHHASAWLSAASLAAAGGLITAGLLLDRRPFGAAVASMFVVAAFCIIAAVVLPLAVVAAHRARTRRWKQRQREVLELDGIVGPIKDGTLRQLIPFNFRLMDRFIAVAIGQARASYVACSVAASAALLVLLTGTAMVLTITSPSGQITAGVLTAAGTALSGFLSVTFLRTFELTSKQMSYYYGQPLVHCYLLHAEWLGERFEAGADPVNRWEIRHELIRAVLGASRNAQNHLLDLQLALHTPPPDGFEHDGDGPRNAAGDQRTREGASPAR